MSTQTAHARIAPSSLALTIACEASVQLQESVPAVPETDEEAEGTAAHLVALWAARERLLGIGEKFKSGDREWTVDIDMHNGARIYAEVMKEGTKGALRLEDPVRVSAIHPTECWGTPDGWEYFKAGTGPREVPVLRVGDYKFGHRYVEVFENWQLLAYALGVMERLELSDDHLILELILVQPRSYTREGVVRKWRVPAVELRALVNIAMMKAEAALGPNPTARTGVHCIDCKARHVCKTLRESVANIVDYSGSAELVPLDAIALGNELRVLDAAFKRLEARRTGLGVAVEAALRAGQRVPHYELRPQRSNIQWLPDTTVDGVAAMADLMGINVRKPPSLMTPRQAIDAGLDEAIVMQYANRPPGGLVVKAVNTTDATKVFGK